MELLDLITLLKEVYEKKGNIEVLISEGRVLRQLKENDVDFFDDLEFIPMTIQSQSNTALVLGYVNKIDE